MPVDVTSTLREALSKLTAEKRRIERQAAAIQDALRVVNGGGVGRPSTNGRVVTRRAKRRRGRMSAAARRAVSDRMKGVLGKAQRQEKGSLSLSTTKRPPRKAGLVRDRPHLFRT